MEKPLHVRLAEEIGRWAVGVSTTKILAPTKYLTDMLDEVGRMEKRTSPHVFKHPTEWNDQERLDVAQAVAEKNPLFGSLHAEMVNMNEVLGMNCMCHTGVPAPPDWMHLEECPARDKLIQPTPLERKAQMQSIYDALDKITARLDMPSDPYLDSCEHGKGINDYCEPCGRVHGSG